MHRAIKQLRFLVELYDIAEEYDYIPPRQNVSEDFYIDGMDNYEGYNMADISQEIVSEIKNLPFIRLDN